MIALLVNQTCVMQLDFCDYRNSDTNICLWPMHLIHFSKMFNVLVFKELQRQQCLLLLINVLCNLSCCMNSVC